MDAKELLALISTPSDAAAVAFGFVVGAPVDYSLLHMSVPLGTVSAYTMATAFFLKKLFDLALEREKVKKARQAPEGKANELLSSLKKGVKLNGLELLAQLGNRHQGLITDKEFEQIVANTAQRLRNLGEDDDF